MILSVFSALFDFINKKFETVAWYALYKQFICLGDGQRPMINPEIQADDCVCYHENKLRKKEEHRSIRVLSKGIFGPRSWIRKDVNNFEKALDMPSHEVLK